MPRAQIVDTQNPSHVRDFLRLPGQIYADIPQWVPPLAMFARRTLNRRKNPFFEHSQAEFFLLYDEGEPIGRLAVLNNRNLNRFHDTRTAHFTLFECVPDPSAAAALFDAAFEWARKQGLQEIVGPKGFTATDGMGLLVRGFEYRPAFGIPYNPSYYVDLIERAGFKPLRELLSGHLDRSAQIPERIHEVAAKVVERRGLSMMRFRSRRELRKIVPLVRELYNNALATMPGNAPLSEHEAAQIADQMIWFADPSIIKVVMKGERPVGFIFAYPDISAALQRTSGRLFPLGWYQMLRELKRTLWVDLNGAGIVEGQRGLGGMALLVSEIATCLLGSRYQHGELVQIRADNERMLREVEKFGVDFYKAHRVYRREL